MVNNPFDSPVAISALRSATHGLLHTSESDEPFEIVHLEKSPQTFGRTDALRVAKRTTDCRVQEQVLEEFFGELAKECDWHGDSEKQDVRRYRQLWRLFGESLGEARVFRVGQIQVDIIIVGKTADGHWVGVKTRAIET